MTKINKTTNEILFDCEADILNNKPRYTKRVFAFLKDYRETNGVETTNNFSKDNFVSIFAHTLIFNPKQKNMLPIWGHHMWNPFDATYFLYCRFRWLFPLRIILSLDCILSSFMTYKNGKNGKHVETSGKLLSYFKCKALDMKWTFRVMTYFIENTKEFNFSWDGVFDIYFKKSHRVSIAYYKNKGAS